MTNTRPNHFIDNVDLLVALLLVASGVSTLVYVVNPAAMGLGGSLIGAGIGLVGHWFNRLYQRLAKDKKDAAEIRKIKALVTAELVNVSFGLIGAERTLAGLVKAIYAGASVGNEVFGLSPRPTPRSSGMSSELLLLTEREIDVLATLESNLALTRLAVDEAANGLSTMSSLTAQRILGHVRGDMELLRQAFECFAPERKFQLEDGKPELATEILGRISKRTT
jgi:hypothetical protein